MGNSRRGNYIGTNPAEIERMVQMVLDGIPCRKIAKELGYGENLVWRRTRDDLRVTAYRKTAAYKRCRANFGMTIRLPAAAACSQLALPPPEDFLAAAKADCAREGIGQMARIAAVVCSYFGVDRADMASPTHCRPASGARQVAMYLCHEILRKPYAEVGRRFNRDHTTVLHARRVVRDQIVKNAGFAANIKALTDMIPPPPEAALWQEAAE